MRICKQAGTEQAKLCANLLKALLKVGNDLFIEVDDQQVKLFHIFVILKSFSRSSSKV